MSKLNKAVAKLVENLSFLLCLVAVVLFSTAGFMMNFVIGLVVTGIMLVVIAYIISPDGDQHD